MDDMTTAKKWSQTVLIAPCWLAAVHVINPASSMLVDGPKQKVKKQLNALFSKMVSVILGNDTNVCLKLVWFKLFLIYNWLKCQRLSDWSSGRIDGTSPLEIYPPIATVQTLAPNVQDGVIWGWCLDCGRKWTQFQCILFLANYQTVKN